MKKKECPSCAVEIEREEKVCPICGYEFPPENNVTKYLVVLLVVIFILFIAWAV